MKLRKKIVLLLLSIACCISVTGCKKENMQLTYREKGLNDMGLTDYNNAKESFIMGLSASNGKLSEVDYDISYYLATTYFKLEEYQEAIDTYGAILALKPKDKVAYYLRGVCELARGNYDSAIKDFDAAIRIDKKDCSMIIDIYNSLKDHGYESVGKSYLESIVKTENASTSLYDRGRICYYLGDYENATNYLNSANQEKTSENITLFLGMSYEELGDINFASTIYQNFLVNHQESVIIYNQLGICKLKVKDYAAALEAFQKALMIENNELVQVLQYNEIVAYEYLGEFKKATVLMETYLANYPDDQKAIREYEFLQTR